MTLESIMAAFAIVALVNMVVDILDVKFKFFNKIAQMVSDVIYVLSVAMIIILWLFSIATVEVAQ